MDLKKTLISLVTADGIAGDEHCAAMTACEMLKEYCPGAYIDGFGNVIGTLSGTESNTPHILLDAHIDEIGMIVTYITDEGFLKVSNCGGIDRRLLSAQTVNIFGKKTIKGIVTSMPPHLSDDDKKLPKIEDFFIDTGYSKTALEKIISLGDRVSVESFPAELLNGCFSSKAIDDRSGVAAILLTLEKLKGKDIPMKVTALFSAQEETGERGAKTAAFTISPDMAIAVDVSFALTNDDSEFKCGKLGKGPMIGIAPSLDRKMSDDLINTAKENEISYQIEIMNGTTGTNADVIGVTRGGVKAVTVSIPLKYMHTPVEVVDFEDIEKTAELMAKFILGGGK